MIDRSAIFTSILARNALRREAHLPLVDVRQTFEREVERKLWIEFARANAEQVHLDVLRSQRERFGPDYPQSGGGRMAVGQLVHRELRRRYRAQRPG